MNHLSRIEQRGPYRKRCILYVRFLHITAVIEVVTLLMKHCDLAYSRTSCAVLNYTFTASEDLQFFWYVLVWEIQVRVLTVALQGGQSGRWKRFLLNLARAMVIIPLVILGTNMAIWESAWDSETADTPECVFNLWYLWVLNMNIALNFFVHGVFLLLFLVLTRQAYRTVMWLMADLDSIPKGNGIAAKDLEATAFTCEKRAKSSAIRNVLITFTAMLCVSFRNGIIPMLYRKYGDQEAEKFIYIGRIATVLSVLATNLVVYLVFADWATYLCYCCCHRTGLQRSVIRKITNSSKRKFYRREDPEKGVEFYASPALIYNERKPLVS